MLQIFGTLIAVVLLFLAGVTHQVQAAATSNGQLLQFYPISPEQYASIVNLINEQHPAVPEGRVLSEGHRSIAEWSNSMPQGWGRIFDLNRVSNDDGGGGGVKRYPLCVLKVNGTKKRNRQRYGRQDDYDYAGVAPTVIYTSSGQSEYPHGPPHGPPPHGPPHYGPPHYGPPGHEIETPEDNGKQGPVINCVVVVRRKGQRRTTTPRPSITQPPTYPYPHPYPQPHPPPHSHPPPPYYNYPGYPPYGYPHHKYPPPPPPPPSPKANTRELNEDNGSPAIDLASQLTYQTMLTEYYHQLARLYMANSRVQAGRGWRGVGAYAMEKFDESPEQASDDDDEEYDDATGEDVNDDVVNDEN